VILGVTALGARRSVATFLAHKLQVSLKAPIGIPHPWEFISDNQITPSPVQSIRRSLHFPWLPLGISVAGSLCLPFFFHLLFNLRSSRVAHQSGHPSAFFSPQQSSAVLTTTHISGRQTVLSSPDFECGHFSDGPAQSVLAAPSICGANKLAAWLILRARQCPFHFLGRTASPF
jgi:hypothetical protein